MKNRVALVVEDDPILQRAMTNRLGRMGFDALGALHYDAALLRLAERRPHLVCVNLELPTESGYEVCEYIRRDARLARVPIIVTSESGYPEAMASAERAGANAFLKKPFTMAALVAYVEALVHGHESEPHLRRLWP